MKYFYLAIFFIFCSSTCFAAPKDPAEAKVNPKSVELNEKGAVALQAHDTQGAEKLFLQAYNIDPANLTAAYNLAGAYVANNKESEAIALLTKVTRNKPKDAGLYARLGDAYFSNQNINDAAKAYEQALALDSNYPSIPSKLGAIYAMQNKLKDAEVMLEKAVAEAPEDAKTLSNYASVLLANKKPEEAIRAAKKSLQGKVDAQTYVTLGQSYDAMKDANNALIAYEKAVALGTRSADLMNRIDQIKKFKAAKS